MTQPGLERSLHACLVPPGPLHIHGVQTTGFLTHDETVRWAGLCAALPLDYLTKACSTANISDTYLQRYPFPHEHPLDAALLLRTLRLNCLTADYAPLWEELFDPAWRSDAWTDPALTRIALGEVGDRWAMATPLRRDQERRQALVEIDAIAAIMLGLTAEQLCAMYRTQFAVLRKYEYSMVFDAEGRKICAHHQSAGYRQARLQDAAKAGDRDPKFKNVWKLYEQFEDDPGSVDWEGEFTAPFVRADRETEMTRAYETFTARLP